MENPPDERERFEADLAKDPALQEEVNRRRELGKHLRAKRLRELVTTILQDNPPPADLQNLLSILWYTTFDFTATHYPESEVGKSIEVARNGMAKKGAGRIAAIEAIKKPISL